MNDNSFSKNVLMQTPASSAAMDDVARRVEKGRRRSWLSESAATALIVVALGGLAAWGHFTGWTMPKFSELFIHVIVGGVRVQIIVKLIANA